MLKIVYVILIIGLLLVPFWLEKKQRKLPAFGFFLIIAVLITVNILLLIVGVDYLPNTTLTNKIIIYSTGGLLMNSLIDLLIISNLALDHICHIKDNYLLIFETLTQITVILSVLIGVSKITSDEQNELLALVMILALTVAPITLGLKWKFKKS